MRQLASIQRIVDIQPIPGADNIEVAQVLGWRVVVKKGEYQVDDLIVYLEIDSWVPNTIAPFLTKPGHDPKTFNGVLGERLRTIKLRGQVSQGLILPLNIVDTMPEIDHWVYERGFTEDDDVTDLLNIQKYEAPVPAQLAGTVRGNFPSFLKKTDETRVQSLPHILEKYQGTLCYIAEKLDGSSMTVYLRDGDFGVCSRNLDLKETEGNAFWQAARKYQLEEKMRAFVSEFGECSFAFQGELVGPGIQKNPLGLDEMKFFVYNVFDIQTHTYGNYSDLLLAAGRFDLPLVPIIDNQHLLVNDTEFYVGFADGLKSRLNTKVLAEGIVVRPVDEINDDRHGRVSFKAISNKYLLKIGE